MATKIQLRRDTAANWTSINPTLSVGEPALETDTGKVKYGDGATPWASLAYFDGGAVPDASPSTKGKAKLYTSTGANTDGSMDQNSITNAINAAVIGLYDDRGNYSASGNVFPSSGGSGSAGAILKGDIWTISTGGTLGGTVVSAGDTVRALVDTPGSTPSNWAINSAAAGSTTPDASPTVKGKAKLFTGTGTGTDGAMDQNSITTALAGKETAGAAAAAQAAAQSYADGLVIGLWDDRGNFSASGGAYPSSGGSGSAGAIKKGDIWTISVAGTLPTGQVVEVGDTVRALIDTPGNTQANWAIAQNNLGYVPVNKAGDTMGGNLALGGNKVTGSGPASAAGELLRFEQLYRTPDALTVSSGAFTWDSHGLMSAYAGVSLGADATITLTGLRAGGSGILRVAITTTSLVTLAFATTGGLTHKSLNNTIATYPFPVGTSKEYFISYYTPDGTTLEWVFGVDGLADTLAAAEAYADAGDLVIQGYAEDLAYNNRRKNPVTVVSLAALPSYTVIAGALTQLQGTVNGAFPTTDGVPVANIASVLVAGETGANKKYNGTYDLDVKGSPGGGGTKYLLKRRWDTGKVSAGPIVDFALVDIMDGTKAGHTFRQSLVNVTIDTSDQQWDDVTPASVVSPVFSGTPTAPTPAVGDDSLKIATTEFVNDEIAASVSTDVINATELGTLFSDNFNRADGSPGSNWTNVGIATFSIVSNKLRMAGGATQTLANYLLWNAYGNCNLDSFTVTFKLVVPTISGTTYGAGITLQSNSSFGFIYHTQILIRMDTGNVGKIVFYGQNNLSTAVTSPNGLTSTAGDILSVVVRFVKSKFLVIVTNGTTKRSNYFEFDIATSYPIGAINVPNSFRVGPIAMGGTIDLDDFLMYGNDPKNVSYLFAGDSITKGYTLDNTVNRVGDLLNQLANINSVTNAGGGNMIEDLNVAEILSLTPRKIIVTIGVNNLTNGDSTSTFATKHAALISALVSGGYVVGTTLFIGLLLPNTSNTVNINTVNNALIALYGDACIDFYTPMVNGVALRYSLDDLHPSVQGHNVMCGTIINKFNIPLTKPRKVGNYYPLFYNGNGRVTVGSGNYRSATPGYLLTVIESGLGSAVRIGKDETDAGGFLGSIQDSNIYSLAGMAYNGANYTWKAAKPSGYSQFDGDHYWYGDTGKTPGTTGTPTLRLFLSITGRLGWALAPTARLHLPAGAAGAGNGPLKFTSGVNLTTGEVGTMEYNGVNLFFTRTGTTRENVLVGNDGAAAPTTNAGVPTTRYGGNTNYLGDPNSWASVVIGGTTYKIPLYT
jgi:lysophospholipase L1-like esterase